jgi:hypothetical protein
MEVFKSDREFSGIQIFQHSGKGLPLFITGHKKCLQADYLLGPGPRLIKKRIYRAAVSQRLRNTGLDCYVTSTGKQMWTLPYDGSGSRRTDSSKRRQPPVFPSLYGVTFKKTCIFVHYYVHKSSHLGPVLNRPSYPNHISYKIHFGTDCNLHILVRIPSRFPDKILQRILMVYF